MCSISGFVSTHPLDKYTAKRLCSALLYHGAERGQQSSGIYVNGKVFKKAIAPAVLIDQSEFFNVFDKTTSMALCHTRQPTSGGHDDAQAQPFVVDDTVVVHNGFFFDITGIKTKWALKKESGVDSELIAQFIHSYGIEMLPQFIESTDGPSATAVIYKGDLFFFRSGNPLKFTIMKLDDGNTVMIFASTDDILKPALHHTWLVPSITAHASPKEGVLFHATPHGITPLSEPINLMHRFQGWKRHADDEFSGFIFDKSERKSRRERKLERKLLRTAAEKAMDSWRKDKQIS